ncbi:MAG: mandelate racemase/muconate lactonizing enzyme family protein [Acidobacteria bacterium]|nr:mandelate racemase/muconate lactonizing enzyme family protein [Acidobacteriota bacterium]
MRLARRDLLKFAMGLPAASWLSNYSALAAPFAGLVKIKSIKTLGLDNLGDGSLIRIDTDAGLIGYGEAGLPAPAARARIEMFQAQLVGQDPLAIARHFYMLSATQYSFMANIPTVSGIDIALWDLAGKITGYPIYKLLGGPLRKDIPVYSHGNPGNMLDKGVCRAWADHVKAEPEGFTAFKFGFGERGGRRVTGPYNPTLDGADFRRTAKGYGNLREAVGDDIDIAMHCTGQFDTRTSIGLCKAIEPVDPMWIEDPLTVRYSEAWRELKRSTRVPLLAGEKVEMVEGFRPYLDNQVLDMIHPDVSYSGGITGCRQIADYAALTRTPVGLHSGPCTLIRFYASMHLGAAIQNFFKVENALGAFRGNKEKMAQGKTPVVRKSVFPVPEGPGLGLDLNEDWLKSHIAEAEGEKWWG